MTNPNPLRRAWRLELKRKDLGSANPICFYCGESNIECLEPDHPVTKDLDPDFKRVVCRNCHRKHELQRDLAKLTTNGQHKIKYSERQQLRRYLLLLAYDQNSIASSENCSSQVAIALQSVAASLRRKASSLESDKRRTSRRTKSNDTRSRTGSDLSTGSHAGKERKAP